MPEVGKDLLNPIIFTLVTNDLFVNTLRLMESGEYYSKDRGCAFEKNLEYNTHGVLSGIWNSLAENEERGDCPLMVLSPTVVNDGRQMILSPQPFSFLVSDVEIPKNSNEVDACLLYTSPSPRDRTRARMPSSA